MKKGITPLRKYNPYKCTTWQRAIEAARRLISNNPELLFVRDMDTCFEMNDSKQVAPLVVKILAQYGYKRFEDLGYWARQSAVQRWWEDNQIVLWGDTSRNQSGRNGTCQW